MLLVNYHLMLIILWFLSSLGTAIFPGQVAPQIMMPTRSDNPSVAFVWPSSLEDFSSETLLAYRGGKSKSRKNSGAFANHFLAAL